MFRSILALLPLLPAALAHGGVIGYNIGGVYYKGFVAYNPAAYEFIYSSLVGVVLFSVCISQWAEYYRARMGYLQPPLFRD